LLQVLGIWSTDKGQCLIFYCCLQVAVDVYGSGPDLSAIEAEATRRGLALSFKGQADHCCPAVQEYKVGSSQQYFASKQGQHLHCAEI
jgi:hypothetical protein